MKKILLLLAITLISLSVFGQEIEFKSKVNLQDGIQLQGVDGTTGQLPTIDATGNLVWGDGDGVSTVAVNTTNHNINVAGVVDFPMGTVLRQDAEWTHTAGTNSFAFTGTPDRVEVTVSVYCSLGGVSTSRYQPQIQIRKNGTAGTFGIGSTYIRSQEGNDDGEIVIQYTDYAAGTNPSYQIVTLMGTTTDIGGTAVNTFGTLSQVILKAF